MNDRDIYTIQFNDWTIIATVVNFDYLSMREMATVFIRYGDEYTHSDNELNFYLYDESDKLIDVSKMPSYIYSDWIIYNKKEINMKVLDKSIRQLLDIGTVESEFTANELKSIKRELLLKNII